MLFQWCYLGIEPTLNLVLSFLMSWITKAAFLIATFLKDSLYARQHCFTQHLWIHQPRKSTCSRTYYELQVKFFFFRGHWCHRSKKLFPWNIVSHSSFRGLGRGLLVRSLLIKSSDWKQDSFGMAGHLGEADTWNTPQEIWQPRVIPDCFTFQTLSLGTGTPAASRMPSHLAFSKSSLARPLFDR